MFDPLGLITPLHIPGKLLFQQATSLKLSWESKLPDDLIHQWNKWISSMNDISSLVITRCLIPVEFQDSYYELHSFCDASQNAYGSCIYVRCLSKSGKIHTSLVCSKSRVFPRRAVTIPRLELQAAVLSVQLESSLRVALRAVCTVGGRQPLLCATIRVAIYRKVSPFESILFLYELLFCQLLEPRI